ncbi:hypothetical protein TNCV_1884901 [Trichonephila clavipes]|nr:hypothetical protein TNCV_1884901 [Trichonephila clavipes]
MQNVDSLNFRHILYWSANTQPDFTCFIPTPRAANWSQYSLYPASNQRAASKLSGKPKNFENFPPRRGTVAATPGFHRPTNHRHAPLSKKKKKYHRRLVLIWD